MDDLDGEILDRIQRGVPLVRRPFHALAEELDTSEEEVLARVKRLRDLGIVRRLGPIINYRRWDMYGALIAANVDPERIEDVRSVVMAYAEVSHAYLREHSWNLWFTVVAENEGVFDLVVGDITAKAGLRDVRKLKRLKTYKLKVRFKA
jgi:DNA-binding Lrp family transcriptional regulator